MIPLTQPALTGAEKSYVLDALQQNQLSAGAYVRRFETAFADWCGARWAVACSSGTTALHLALLAADVGPGTEVIVPALTYIATANAVRYCGAEPVLCEVDASGCLDPEHASRLIGQRTRAIIAVHLYGLLADMAALRELAWRHGLALVEDAAEAHGAQLLLDGRWQMAGSLADLAAFSFYGNKILTTGEGGMVTTSQPDLAARLRQLRGQGVDPARRYWHPVLGYNYRLSELPAAVGLAQVEQANAHVAARRQVWAWYQARLTRVPWLRWLPARAQSLPAYWLPVVLVADDAPCERDALAARLAAAGIETRPVFPALHWQPIYRQAAAGQRFLQAEWLSCQGLCLPSYVGLGSAGVEQVCQAIEAAR